MDNDLCKTLYEMSTEDQKYRVANGNITEIFSDVLDSLILSKSFTKDHFLSLPEHEQSELKQKALKLARRNLKPDKIDAENTEKLIGIVKKHGWLTAKKLGCKARFKTVLFFRHAPKKYWNEIRPLIEKERIMLLTTI